MISIELVPYKQNKKKEKEKSTKYKSELIPHI